MNSKGILAALPLIVIAAFAVPSAARAQGASAELIKSMPAGSITVTNWYKQNVYDPSNNKIGEIMDVLLDKSGKVTALIVGVGGFLGAGEKDVAVPFEAVRVTTKDNNKNYLVMDTTKDALKAAPGYTYDRNTTTWVPEKKS